MNPNPQNVRYGIRNLVWYEIFTDLPMRQENTLTNIKIQTAVEMFIIQVVIELVGQAIMIYLELLVGIPSYFLFFSSPHVVWS